MNAFRGKPGVSMQEAIWAAVGLKVGGGLIGDPGDNPPFRPLVCCVDGCETRHDIEGEGTAIYVLRKANFDCRYARLVCCDHLQEEIELSVGSVFGGDLIIREAEPKDWTLAGDRVECLTGAR